MAKKTWDKAVHATVLIDPRFTQEDWHHLNRTSQAPPPPPEPGAADFEPRVYNPSGPFYNTTKPRAQKETK